ncbi:MAG TPA: M28 family peptidase [Blastocatellia bacterium]|jgi:hypothetical protein
MSFNNSAGARVKRALLAAMVLSLFLGALPAAAQKAQLSPQVKSALGHISADSLRGHLSFIASDAMAGRNTPSPELDMAAHYIAAQFRRAGLEPAGDDGYFQTASWKLARQDMDEFSLKFQEFSGSINIPKKHVTLGADRAVSLAGAPLLKVDYKDSARIASLTPAEVEGRVVITEMPEPRSVAQTERASAMRGRRDFVQKMEDAKAALIISIDRTRREGSGAGPGRLISPEFPSYYAPSQVSVITVHDARVVEAYDKAGAGELASRVSVNVPAPVEHPVKLRNVIGVLRGSDPALKDTYVLLTAHYDHLGARASEPGDNIYNGANDNGSGTVSVIEIASALARLGKRPRRSIVFIALFGEEKGLLGARHYGTHPVFPLEKTVAMINLEQVGRTDSNEGPQLSNASLTGFDFSTVSTFMKAAGEATGVSVYKHERNSDAFFARSDNVALAALGVPAHTVTVSYVYSDYHGVGDHWEKIDYDNMAKVNRMIALGLILIADSREEPRWNESNPKTGPYVKAWKARRAGSVTSDK